MRDPGPDDALVELGQRFGQRDPAAFEEAFDLFGESVYVIGVLELGDVEEARDLVQETFRRAWAKAQSLEDPARLRSWLFRIARNLCIDISKQSRRRPLPVAEIPANRNQADETNGPLRAAILREKARRLTALMQTVPENFRTVLLLRLMEEKSYQEISRILGMPLHGVKNAIARGGRILIEKVRNSPDLDVEGE